MVRYEFNVLGFDQPKGQWKMIDVDVMGNGISNVCTYTQLYT